MTIANDKKINNRLQLGYAIVEQELDSTKFKNLKLIPKNFLRLFYYGKYTCKCHKQHLSIKQVLQHAGKNVEEFMSKLILTEEPKKEKKIGYN